MLRLGVVSDKLVFLDRDVSGKRRVCFLTTKTCTGNQGTQQGDIMSGGDLVRNISNTLNHNYRQTKVLNPDCCLTFGVLISTCVMVWHRELNGDTSVQRRPPPVGIPCALCCPCRSGCSVLLSVFESLWAESFEQTIRKKTIFTLFSSCLFLVFPFSKCN